MQLDPSEADSYVGLGNIHQSAGDYKEAISAYTEATTINPRHANAHAHLGDAYNALGKRKNALVAYQRAVELNGSDALSRGSLAGLYRNLGRQEDYTQEMDIARELISDESEYNRACLEAIAGNNDEALALLQVALDRHQVQMEWVQKDPDLESVRQDPRFMEIFAMV